MNLEGTERSVARRLIDFASGICYADGRLDGEGRHRRVPPQARTRSDQPRYDEYDD